MKQFLPSTKEITSHIASYIDEAEPLVAKSFKRARNSAEFREIYKATLATDVVLESLSDPRIKPSLEAVRTAAVRTPILVALAQISVATIELRRFLEVAIWSIYFTHHPVEWEHFEGKRGLGFTRNPSRPIALAAHRDLNSYMLYAKEYMEAEPSGIATEALRSLEADKKLLNAAVHAGDIARKPSANPPFDGMDIKSLRKFAGLQRRIFSHTLIVLSCVQSREIRFYVARRPRTFSMDSRGEYAEAHQIYELWLPSIAVPNRPSKAGGPLIGVPIHRGRR